MTAAAVPLQVTAANGRARAVLADRARALARPTPVDDVQESVRLIMFLLGGQPHGLEAGFVREVLRPFPLATVPWAPAPLAGVGNVRGEILAVADIRPLLGLDAADGAGRVLVLEGDAPPLGLVVEEVRDLVDVPVHSIVPVPGDDTAGGASLLRGVAGRTAVLSAGAVLRDPRLSTTDTRSRP